MWLRRGKYNLENGTLHHKVQHVPFGTAIILPWGEFHAGNYGKKDNTRLHIIVGKSNWNSSKLELLTNRMEKHKEKKEGTEENCNKIIQSWNDYYEKEAKKKDDDMHVVNVFYLLINDCITIQYPPSCQDQKVHYLRI